MRNPLKVILSTPDWAVSGVNTVHHSLARGLQQRGHRVELVVLPVGRPAEQMDLPTEIPVRILCNARATWKRRWSALIAHLNREAPCLYLPGYDFDHSCVVPALSNDVGVIGVVHSDDPYHYEHLIRMGRYWNAAVAVSAFLLTRMIALEPLVAPISRLIYSGVSIPGALPRRSVDPLRPLRLIYTGRFEEGQKRVSSLPKIADALARRGIATEWTLVGGGPDESILRNGFARLTPSVAVSFTGVLPADAVLAQYARSDCFILTSEFEGLPISLLEAMAQGVIPAVSDVESGIPEIVTHGVNGFRVPIGDIDTYADCLAALAFAPRQPLHDAVFRKTVDGGLSVDTMLDKYIELFESVRWDIDTGAFRRPRPYRPGSRTGMILPPPRLQPHPDMLYPVQRLRRIVSGLRPRLRALMR